MISTNDFKTGVTVKIDGNIFQVLEFLHVKPGKGQAFVRSKIKNLRTGAIVDYTFNAGEKLEKAFLEKNVMQYLYDSGEFCVFMNNENYEQVEIPRKQITNELKYLPIGLNVEVVLHENEVLGITLPDKVTLQVTKTEPAVKGDTKTSASKDAILETGILVKVPLFVNENEKIIVNTNSGEYVSREK